MMNIQIDQAPLTNQPGEQLKRLEVIFHPFARRRRTEWYQDKPTARFVHYTTAQAALKIITSKRLWMRNATCMADYREVQHGFDNLVRVLFSEPTRGEFVNALERCAPGSATKAMEVFANWRIDAHLSTYITSLSEHNDKESDHGRLSMWRAFGGSDLPRVAIVLNIPVNAPGVEALKIMSSPVAYFTKEQLVGELNDVIQNIKTEAEFLMTFDSDFVAGCVVTMLLAGVTCLKHEGFDEEREWRAIYSPNRLHSPLMESSTEIVGGVPQLVYNLPLDGAIPGVPAELELSRMFHRLIIGPSQYPWVMYERFVAALASAGVTDVGNRVVMSGIPIRS